MTALTRDRNTPWRRGEDYGYDVAGGAQIFAGALVVLNATGYAEPGSTATGLKPAGVAKEQIDNSGGADGDADVVVRRGVFQLENDGSIDRTHIGSSAYIVDDQTVAATDGGATRSAAGTIEDVDVDGVWVRI
ncbi:MAG: hypothetical protein R3175_07475 [Marinobacter sp.]|uniref:hypothetical protein n=1 Tax=Marinobacter sp. TaxID=50741 RepID=UPI00299E8D23|nr:hypothetical protein [Marinobacter sp.]MDX1755880.1 hypothetical protein [Marinobacter sp.]